jgi:hypothetical protein
MAADNTAGFAALDDMVTRLRALPAEFQSAAPELARDFKAEADKAVAEGRSLDGVPWAPKKDGGRALVHAAKAVRAFVSGTFIVLEVSGIEAIHHYGTQRVPARRILPVGAGVPLKLGQAIRRGLVKKWDAAMRGPGG